MKCFDDYFANGDCEFTLGFSHSEQNSSRKRFLLPSGAEYSRRRLLHSKSEQRYHQNELFRWLLWRWKVGIHIRILTLGTEFFTKAIFFFQAEPNIHESDFFSPNRIKILPKWSVSMTTFQMEGVNSHQDSHAWNRILHESDFCFQTIFHESEFFFPNRNKNTTEMSCFDASFWNGRWEFALGFSHLEQNSSRKRFLLPSEAEYSRKRFLRSQSKQKCHRQELFRWLLCNSNVEIHIRILTLGTEFFTKAMSSSKRSRICTKAWNQFRV